MMKANINKDSLKKKIVEINIKKDKKIEKNNPKIHLKPKKSHLNLNSKM